MKYPVVEAAVADCSTNDERFGYIHVPVDSDAVNHYWIYNTKSKSHIK